MMVYAVAKMGSHMKRFELLRKFIVYQLPVT